MSAVGQIVDGQVRKLLSHHLHVVTPVHSMVIGSLNHGDTQRTRWQAVKFPDPHLKRGNPMHRQDGRLQRVPVPQKFQKRVIVGIDIERSLPLPEEILADGVHPFAHAPSAGVYQRRQHHNLVKGAACRRVPVTQQMRHDDRTSQALPDDMPRSGTMIVAA